MTKLELLKTIRLTDQTHKRLSRLGKYGETMDDIINKCIDAYEKSRKIE